MLQSRHVDAHDRARHGRHHASQHQEQFRSRHGREVGTDNQARLDADEDIRCAGQRLGPR